MMHMLIIKHARLQSLQPTHAHMQEDGSDGDVDGREPGGSPIPAAMAAAAGVQRRRGRPPRAARFIARRTVQGARQPEAAAGGLGVEPGGSQDEGHGDELDGSGAQVRR